MSENDHKKRSLDDSDGHDSDSKDRSHKRIAVQGSKTNSPERPQHRRRDDEDGKIFLTKCIRIEETQSSKSMIFNNLAIALDASEYEEQ